MRNVEDVPENITVLYIRQMIGDWFLTYENLVNLCDHDLNSWDIRSQNISDWNAFLITKPYFFVVDDGNHVYVVTWDDGDTLVQFDSDYRKIQLWRAPDESHMVIAFYERQEQ